MPRVSVLLPAYNCEKYLAEAIDSMLNQTYKDFELIIMNDGSTDKTEEIILSYNDDRIVYVKNEKNLGLISTLNNGLKLCKGEFIARMDGDDICKETRFEKQVKFLDENPDVIVVSSPLSFFGLNKSGINYLKPDYYDFINDKTMIAHAPCMLRNKVIKDNNIEYNADFPHAEDYKLWNDLKHYGKMHAVDEVFYYYRKHEEAVTYLHRDVSFDSVARINIIEYEKMFDRKLFDYEVKLIRKEYKDITAKEFWCFHSKIIKYLKKDKLDIAVINWLSSNMKSKFDVISLLKNFRYNSVIPLLRYFIIRKMWKRIKRFISLVIARLRK